MRTTAKLIGYIIAGVAASMVVAGVGTSGEAYAAENADHASEKVTYTYVANAGDTYTQLVRKAVQTYGIKHDESVGVGRIVAIETRVSEQSGWPMLNEGQTVSFSEGLVKAWIDEAMKLSEADMVAWGTYAPYIDFDTRGIGE